MEWYREEFGVSLDKKDMKGKRIYDIVSKENLDAVRNYPNHPDFFKDLPVFEGAVSVIRELSIKYEIYFVSTAMEYPNSLSMKYGQ